MRMERSEEVERRTVEEGKKWRERMVDRCGVPLRFNSGDERDAITMEPSA